MDNFFSQIPLIVLPLVIGILLFMYFSSDKKHLEEENKTPELSFKTGGVIGWTNYKGPFIRVTVYQEFLIIAYLKIILLKYDEFTIQEESFLFRKSIYFQHKKSEYPNPIRLYISDKKKFLDLMSLKGVHIIKS